VIFEGETNMNFKKIAFLTFMIAVFSFILMASDMITTLNAQPGSEADPLVSRSYLEERLRNLSPSTSGPAGGIIPDELLQFLIDDITAAVLAEQAPTYRPINVLQGQTLIGGEGTEIILRGGSAVAFSEVVDGLVNATAGTELFNGAAIPLNNILLVSRDDGRGVTITSESAWLIVRGNYTIR